MHSLVSYQHWVLLSFCLLNRFPAGTANKRGLHLTQYIYTWITLTPCFRNKQSLLRVLQKITAGTSDKLNTRAFVVTYHVYQLKCPWPPHQEYNYNQYLCCTCWFYNKLWEFRKHSLMTPFILFSWLTLIEGALGLPSKITDKEHCDLLIISKGKKIRTDFAILF